MIDPQVHPLATNRITPAKKQLEQPEPTTVQKKLVPASSHAQKASQNLKNSKKHDDLNQGKEATKHASNPANTGGVMRQFFLGNVRSTETSKNKDLKN